MMFAPKSPAKQQKLQEFFDKLEELKIPFIKRDEQGIHTTLKGPDGQRVDVWPTTDTWVRMPGYKQKRTSLDSLWVYVKDWGAPIEGA